MEQYFRTRASVDDEPDLARNRRANDARLKSRFEHIFAKYGKDFEDVGDEIDLDTGEIVVNNGHLESMRHEVDPGKSVSSQVLQVLGGSAHSKRKNTIPTVGFVNEISTEDSDLDDGASVADLSGYSSSNADVEEDNDRQPKATQREPDQPSNRVHEFRYEDEPRPGPEQRSIAFPEQQTGSGEPNIKGTSQPTSRGPSPGTAPTDLPFLQDSMTAALSNPGQSGSIDPNLIQALGQSIASQLARFMSNPSKKRKSESSSRRAPNDSRWEYPVLPGDRTARTPSPVPPASSSAALFARSPDDENSIWAAERPRRPKRQRTSLGDAEALGFAADDDEPVLDDTQAPAPRTSSKTTEGRMCSHCGDMESSKWRIGPDGGYLCNACGTYYFRYGRPRPSEVLRSASKPDLNQASPAGSIDVYSIPLTSTPGISGYAANTARRMAGDARYVRFTLEEEDAIIKLRAVDQLDWKRIGELVSNRSESSVQGHYRKLRKRPDFEDRLRLLARDTSKSPALSERAYKDTPTQNQAERASLSQVASVKCANSGVPGFQKEVLPTAHASPVSAPTRPNGSEGPGSRPRFSVSEKQLLVRLRKENMDWMEIANYLPGRTLNSIKAMDRRLSLAQGSSEPDDETFNGCLQSHQEPYTTEEDDLILLVRDQEGKSFAEMTEYFAGRSEAALMLRYEHLKSLGLLPSQGEPISVDVPSHTLAKPGPPRPALWQDAQHEAIQSQGFGDSCDQMPPPPRPASRLARVDGSPVPAASVLDPHRSSVLVADRYNPPLPQTPSFPISPLRHPPPPLEVGPSAWNTTQPTSKGPLPFKPARRSLIPVVPRGSYTIADPFSSAREFDGDQQIRRSEDASPNIEHRPRRHAKERARASLKDLYEATYAVDGSTLIDPSSQSYDGFVASTIAAAQGSLPSDPSGSTITPDPVEDEYKPTSPAVKIHAHETDATPEKKHRVHYSEEESKRIKHLKEQGFSYSKIAAQMPGRTPISIQNHYYYTYTSTVPNSKAQSGQKTARRTLFGPPLLRQALDNSTRRSSAGPDVVARVVDTTRKFLRENDSGSIVDDDPQSLSEGSVASDEYLEYDGVPPNEHVMPQAFNDKLTSEMTDNWGVPSSGRDYNPSSFPMPLQRPSSGPKTDVATSRPGGRSTTSRRDASSPCVYIESIVRSEGNSQKCDVSSRDHTALEHSPATTQAPADATPVGFDNSHGCSRDGRMPVPSPHAEKPSVREASSEGLVQMTQSPNDDANPGLGLDLNEQSAHETRRSQDPDVTSQNGTTHERRGGRPKRVSSVEVADSDSDTVCDPSSQATASGNGDENNGDPTAEARVTPVKRGRGRPWRSVPVINSSHPCESTKVPKSLADSEPHQTATPEIITISSDPSVKPDATSENNTATTRPVERPVKTQQPTPRSKSSRYSDSALVQRPSTSATPARSGDSNISFLPRPGTSGTVKRFESLSRTAGPRENSVTRDGSGMRRIILATAAGNDGGNEELDELS